MTLVWPCLILYVCVGHAALTPLLKFCPVAVLWGYFAYMALDSLPGNQFWQRILLLGTDKTQHYKYAPCCFEDCNPATHGLHAWLHAGLHQEADS